MTVNVPQDIIPCRLRVLAEVEMKKLLGIISVAFFATATAAQQAPPVFHNFKIGVPLSQQTLKFCTTRREGTISIIDGENLTPCLGFSGYHDDTNRSTQLPVLLGGYPEQEASDHRDSTLTILFPNDSETIGDATVEGVTIEMAAGNPQGVISGVKQKWGPPSSCHTTPMRTGLGIPIARLSCSWKLR